MDKTNTNFKSVTAQFTFEPKFYIQPIVFANTDLSAFDGKEAVIDYMSARIQQAQIEGITAIGQNLFWVANATLVNPKAIWGLIEAVDDGTNFAAYAGLTRGSYPDPDPNRSAALGFMWTPSYIWGNHIDWVVLTIEYVDRMIRACSNGFYRPTHIVTTKALKAKLKYLNNTTNFVQPVVSLRSPMEMWTSAGLTAQVWFTEVEFNGLPVIDDPFCPAGMLFVVNLETFSFKVKDQYPGATPLKFASSIIEGSADKNFTAISTWFFKTQNITPADQQGFVTNLIFAWQLVCKQPKYNGYFTNAT